MAEVNEGASTRDYLLLGIIAAIISTFAFIFYFHQDKILLYGDAVAHINIARHVFDSRTPGILEFGTVWLPLPHLLDMPFVANDSLWRSGIGASIPSMLAFIAGVLGIFRLVRGLVSRAAAWIAALIYALNPNLIYMQSTAMTEALYLALFIWAMVHFSKFVREARSNSRRAGKSLEYCAMMIAAASLVRYDGWFLAFCITVALIVIMWRFKPREAVLWRAAINFVLLTSLTAGLWLAYNHGAYGRVLEFAQGPYSARAIAERSKTPTFPIYPGENSPRTAALYFLKVARLNSGEGPVDFWLLGIAFAALLATIYFSRRHLHLSLLWIPFIFYVLSIAYGSVPIFFPQWWPFSYYNVRYGLELLPAIAVFVALAYQLLSNFVSARWVAAGVLLLMGWSYSTVWANKPICLREAEVNGAARMDFDARLGAELKKLTPSATIMMYCGEHSGALQNAGLPFRRVLREGNHPAWEIGLNEPAKAADYVVAIPEDEVFYAVRVSPQKLSLVATVETSANTRAWIYRSLH